MISRMTLPKTKLFIKKKVIIIQVIINSVVHYPLQNFRDSRKYGNWPIVFLPDLKTGVTFSIFMFSGKMLRFIDSLKIFSNGFFMNSCTDVTIFISKPSWPGALFLLSDLNASSNSSSLNSVSFKVVFTVGRYDLKVRSH